MVKIRNEFARDIDAREALLDRVWGATRWQKTAERLRAGRRPAEGLSFVAEENGCVVGTVRLWRVCAGPARPALLLGPLAVEEARRSLGTGTALMQRAIAAARRLGHQAVLLVGDAPYYGRFGFSAEKTGAPLAARPVRAASPARLRTRAGRARWRARAHRCDWASGTGAEPRRPRRASRPRRLGGAPRRLTRYANCIRSD